MICAALFCILAPTVVDGDTFRARTPEGWQQTFRVWGIDTPERDEPGHGEARDALAALVDRGLSCDVAGAPTWGRLVVRCQTAEGQDLGCEMIRQGHAEEWLAFSRGAYAGCGGER